MIINEYTEKLTSTLKSYVHTRIQDVENRIIESGGGGISANPAGTVIQGMWVTAPVGYLPCDGSIYQVEDYLVLYDILSDIDGHASWNSGADWTTTFATPDLRGEFLRGTGTNSHANQGSGAAVGVHQNGTNHIVFGVNGNIGSMWVRSSADGGQTEHDSLIVGANKTGRDTGALSSWNSDGQRYFTSRPTNTSVLYCIKY